MATRYPIVLVHGVLIKETKLIHAFGRIAEVLKERGFSVYVADVDAFGTSATNAYQLASFIDGVLLKEGSEKVNIIGHSKGGLDTVYAIQKLGIGGKIASLTTLCTPHRGSEIASAIWAWKDAFKKPAAAILDFVYKYIFGDKTPNSYEVCRELCCPEAELNSAEVKLAAKETELDATEGELDIANATLGTAEEASKKEGACEASSGADETAIGKESFGDIYCQSYSATMERGRDCPAMALFLGICKRAGRMPSDGVVHTESTKFGSFRGDFLDGSFGHVQVTDILAKRRDRDKIYGFYEGLCRELSEMGF